MFDIIAKISSVKRNYYMNYVVQNIKISMPVSKYNQFMGGVDISDQFCIYIETEKKNLKWWKNYFFTLYVHGKCLDNK